MLNSYDAILKNKRENYRSEIRKKDLSKKMGLKRQMLLNRNVSFSEIEFKQFLKNFKFMLNCSSPKDVPNKVWSNNKLFKDFLCFSQRIILRSIKKL